MKISPTQQQFTIAQFNVENLYPAGDPNIGNDGPLTEREYATKLAKLERAIVDELHTPDIIAMQEVGNPQALADLVARPGLAAAGYAFAQLPTNDLRRINTAVLYRPARVQLEGVRQLTPDLPAGMAQPRGGIDPTKLFARPPLVADFSLTGANQAAAGARQVQLVVNHMMSKARGANDSEPYRIAQARHLAGYVDAQRAAQPERGVIVVGDLNTSYGEEPYELIEDLPDGSARLHDAPKIGVPEADRFTYEFKGQREVIDHMMISPDLSDEVTSVRIPHINSLDWDPELRRRRHEDDPSVATGVSDHDPVVTTFTV